MADWESIINQLIISFIIKIISIVFKIAFNYISQSDFYQKIKTHRFKKNKKDLSLYKIELRKINDQLELNEKQIQLNNQKIKLNNQQIKLSNQEIQLNKQKLKLKNKNEKKEQSKKNNIKN